MKRKHLIAGAIALLLAFALSAGLSRRVSGKNKTHKPTLHRANCANLATATDSVGFALVQMDSSGNLQIEVALKQGMPRTDYKTYVLAAPCTIIFTDDILTTNKKGKGNIHVMVPVTSIPANATVAVQLVSPPNAVVPGPGPFTDLITSNFVTPQKESEEAENGRF